MSLDSTPARSRRAVLAAAAGAVAATAVAAVATPLPVLGAGDDGQIIHVGDSFFDVRSTTTLENSQTNQDVFVATTSGSGTGLFAHSGTGYGVQGDSGTKAGVEGTSSTGNGVQGETTSATASGVYGQNLYQGYGVAGRSTAGPLVNGAGAAAVLGDNTANGIGVWARSAHGVALLADPANPDAIALKAQGVTQFKRSGTLTIVAGKSSVQKTGIRVDAGTLVLATLQQNRSGVWIQAAVPNATGDSFSITLNKAVSSSIKVGWFLVN